MNKKTIKALEKVFWAEVTGALPFQAKAEIYWDLVGDGFLEAVKVSIGSSPPQVIVEGFILTDKGRYEYCKQC